MRCYLASRWRIQKTEETGLKQLEAAVTSLDQGGDRDALLQQHDAAFCLPFRFNYHPHEGDQVKLLSLWDRCMSSVENRKRMLLFFTFIGIAPIVWRETKCHFGLLAKA